MIRYVRIRKFCAETGYTDDAVRAKIIGGFWSQRRHWILSPDGDILVSPQAHLKPERKRPRCELQNVNMLRLAAAHTTDLPIGVGVYFLFRDDELLYVGKSKHLLMRVGQHMAEGKIPFNRVSWLNYPQEELSRMEAAYIYLLKPSLNQKMREQ